MGCGSPPMAATVYKHDAVFFANLFYTVRQPRKCGNVPRQFGTRNADGSAQGGGGKNVCHVMPAVQGSLVLRNDGFRACFQAA